MATQQRAYESLGRLGGTASSLEVVPEAFRRTDVALRAWRMSALGGGAFGFATGDLVGNRSSGTVETALGGGMALLGTTSKYVVESGYSGAEVWSPPSEYDAVVGIVVQAKAGDARALTLHQIDALIPEAELSVLAETFSVTDSGTVALAQWAAPPCATTGAGGRLIVTPPTSWRRSWLARPAELTQRLG